MTGPVIFLLIASVFATSLLSGVFGMLGGMILMVILLTVLPIAAAMSVHAAVQLTSNGWRCFLWRRHIVWSSLPWYLGGIVIGFTLMLMVHYVPDKNTALIMMGSVPLLSMLASRFVKISIMNPGQTVVASTLLTFIHLTAGVVGPLLDLLYINAPLTRQQIIATKAFTQTVMHCVRLGYFGVFLTWMAGQGFWPSSFDPLYLPILLVASVAGTTAAAWFVHRMDDKHFKLISRILIAMISCYCLYQGVTGKFGLAF